MNIRKSISTAVFVTTLLTGTVGIATAADHLQEKTNLLHFHVIDFVGWNNSNMDVMRKYHRADVAVDMVGMHTDGIDPHVELLAGMLSQGAAKIVQHSPSVAQGAWTAVVGVTASGNIATIGEWQDGALANEYLFVRALTADELKAVDVSTPIQTITTPDDADLRATTGAEAGWSAVMVDGFAVFTQIIDGKVAQQLGFASN